MSTVLKAKPAQPNNTCMRMSCIAVASEELSAGLKAGSLLWCAKNGMEQGDILLGAVATSLVSRSEKLILHSPRYYLHGYGVTSRSDNSSSQEEVLQAQGSPAVSDMTCVAQALTDHTLMGVLVLAMQDYENCKRLVQTADEQIKMARSWSTVAAQGAACMTLADCSCLLCR